MSRGHTAGTPTAPGILQTSMMCRTLITTGVGRIAVESGGIGAIPTFKILNQVGGTLMLGRLGTAIERTLVPQKWNRPHAQTEKIDGHGFDGFHVNKSQKVAGNGHHEESRQLNPVEYPALGGTSQQHRGSRYASAIGF